MNAHQLAEKAAMDIGCKAHKNVPTVNAYYIDIATAIIQAALEIAYADGLNDGYIASRATATEWPDVIGSGGSAPSETRVT